MEEVKRRAPKNGYDNTTKSKYRHKVWRYLSKNVIPVLNKHDNAKVLMLPSKEGIEIDVAIKFGIKPEQIIAIDENPALLAHAKWKCKIPKENRFGCKVSKVGKKIKSNGWFLAGANLDFCNTFSQELINEINTFLNDTPISDSFSFCITMGKGRESKALFTLLKHINAPKVFNHNRLATLYEVLEVDRGYSYLSFKDRLSLDFEESYYESFPMIYAAFSLNEYDLSPHKELRERHTQLRNRRRKLKRPISRDDGYNPRRERILKERLQEMKCGDFWDTDWLESTDKEYRKERIKEEHGKLVVQQKYNNQNIHNRDLRDKRNRLCKRINKELSNIESKVYKALKEYCDDNNMIKPDIFIKHYLNKFINRSKWME